MGKPKRSTNERSSRGSLKKHSNKLSTEDRKVKKKLLKHDTPFKCKICKKKFAVKYNLTAHQKLHLDLEFPCSICSYVGKTRKYLGRHIRQTHTPPTHACSVCGKAFVHPGGLREHVMVHTGEKPLKCEVCGKAFRVSYTLNMHMLVHKNEKPFKCSFCEYACRDSSTLRRHEHRHMGIVKMLPCKLCHKKFPNKTRLKHHISEVHLDYLEIDLKKHKCEHCGKGFKKNSILKYHIESVHDPTQVCSCPVCGIRIKHKRYLPNHLRSHLPQRPHVCKHEGCGKRFKTKGYLKKHSIIHSPHLHQACSKCGATFSRPHRLLSHMKTHEPKEKSVVCDYCGVSFYTKNYLIKHITQKHCEEKQKYICDNCGLVTYNKPGIVMHIKYGQCRDKVLYCKICKTRYKNVYTLRNHYLRTHKMRYKPMKRQKKKEKKPLIDIKVEPIDADPYEEVKVSLLVMNKEEIDVEDEANLENDLVLYSKHVLSEDLQEYLLNDQEGAPEPDTFDEFLMQHVFHKQVKNEPEAEQNNEESDNQQETLVTEKIKEIIKKAEEEEANKLLEKKRKMEAKKLEKKLKREAKIMRRKRRRERYELERVRQWYNERMKRAAAEASKKKPEKKITYFKKKTTEEEAVEKEIVKTRDKCNDSTNENASTNVNNNSESNGAETDDSITNQDSLNDNNIKTNTNASVKISGLSNGSKDFEKNLENGKLYDENFENSSSNHDNVNISNDNAQIFEGDNTSGENDSTNYTYFGSKNDKHVDLSDKKGISNEDGAVTNDVGSFVNDASINTDDIDNTNDKIKCTNDEETRANNENKRANECNDKNKCENGASDTETLTTNIASDTNNVTFTNNNINHVNESDNDDDCGSKDEKSDSDSDYDPSSGEESTPLKKLKFRTFQCYICFKLFQSKEELLTHCANHFDICNSTTLSKCPVCGHVASRQIEEHMRKKHKMCINVPHNRIERMEGNNEQGSKYCFKTPDAVIEIIPSVKRLNYQASVELDKRNREMRDKTVAKAKLVKKGAEWILEKVNVDVSCKELPEFTEEELSSVPVSNNNTERLGQLGRLARAKGVTMMYPCDRCDKICQNFSALRLHGRRHDPNKKPFAPKKYKRNCKSPPVPKEKPKVTNFDNRIAKPKPITNKHRCDENLKKFYETHIRGADIEFWQFLKIYNKMDRENIQDFTDLEGRVEFGIHTNEERINNDPKSGNIDPNTAPKSGNKKPQAKTIKSFNDSKERKTLSKTAQQFATKMRGNVISDKTQKFNSKLGQQSVRSNKKPMFKRVIMISRKQHLEREKAKIKMREKLKGNNP